ETVRAVADLLRNTPAVCRRCYIHPVVLDAFESGALATLAVRRSLRGLRADEAAFVALLVSASRRAAR
ncbi:DNA topoisomerase IB, partial [Burkholderia cenocepacia]|nr:DNA topoisomerase IB [Burkholderia cenocepacia]